MESFILAFVGTVLTDKHICYLCSWNYSCEDFKKKQLKSFERQSFTPSV